MLRLAIHTDNAEAAVVVIESTKEAWPWESCKENPGAWSGPLDRLPACVVALEGAQP